jgi:hypothetical protein
VNTLADLRRWALEAPPGTVVPVSSLVELLDAVEDPAPIQVTEAAPETWRERLWSCGAEVRLSVADVAEALGRPKSYVYQRTGPKAEDPIPHRKCDGSVVVTAGELRAWIRAHETVIHAGPMESAPTDRVLRSVS